MSAFTLNLKRRACLGIAVFQLIGLTACSNLPLIKVQETVPQDVAATSQVLQVTHRNKINNFLSDGYFEIANYAITRIKKDSISSSSAQMGPYSQTKTKSGFQFNLTNLAENKSQWNVRCDVRIDGNVVKVFGLDTISNKRHVQCNLNGAEGTASLNIREEMDTPKGELSINQSNYSVRAYTYENPHPDPFRIPKVYGFRVDSNGVNQGAIELSDTPGRAWLNPNLSADQKAAMTAALAAMLIQYGS